MMVKYKCNVCGNTIKKIYKQSKDKAGYLTCYCGGVLERQMGEISSTSIEIVDNGNMARQVELRKDVVQHLKDRGDKLLEEMENRDKPVDKK